MGLAWADNFSQYPIGQLPPGVWSGRSLPTVATGGRDNGKRVTWNANAMLRPLTGGASFIRMAMRIDSGGFVRTWNNSAGAITVPNTLTSWHWICGGSWNGYAYCGLVVTEDGGLHVVNGGGFESGPNSTLVSVVASSAPGVVPLQRGWFLLEASFVWALTGSVVVRINGNEVLNYTGYTKSPEDFCAVVLKVNACPLESPVLWPDSVTEFGIGGITRGAAAIPPTGWVGSIDLLAAFDADPGDVADMEVTDLLPDGDGALSQSTITGTSPAPTRWQSVDDALNPDGAVTTVTFPSPGTPFEDEYTLSAFPYPSPVIYGVQVSANHRVSSPGYASADLGVSDGTNVRYAPPLFSRARTFRVHSGATPERPAGGAWTVADLANLRVRVRRGA